MAALCLRAASRVLEIQAHADHEAGIMQVLCMESLAGKAVLCLLKQGMNCILQLTKGIYPLWRRLRGFDVLITANSAVKNADNLVTAANKGVLCLQQT